AYAKALDVLGEEENLPDDEACHQYAWAWMNRGNLYGIQGTVAGVERALECYERAERALGRIAEAARTDEMVADHGALLANRGHALLRLGGQEKWEQAVDCYQRSVDTFD